MALCGADLTSRHLMWPGWHWVELIWPPDTLCGQVGIGWSWTDLQTPHVARLALWGADMICRHHTWPGWHCGGLIWPLDISRYYSGIVKSLSDPQTIQCTCAQVSIVWSWSDPQTTHVARLALYGADWPPQTPHVVRLVCFPCLAFSHSLAGSIFPTFLLTVNNVITVFPKVLCCKYISNRRKIEPDGSATKQSHPLYQTTVWAVYVVCCKSCDSETLIRSQGSQNLKCGL